MAAKMKTLEEQHQVRSCFAFNNCLVIMFVFFQDYQRHIAVLKESLCAKEDHYNMLQADVSVFFLYFIQPESVEKSRLHRHFN